MQIHIQLPCKYMTNLICGCVIAYYTQVSNCSGLILDDQPVKVGVALKLFLQGLGLVPSLSFPCIQPSLPPPSFTIHGKAAQLHQCEAY